MQGRVVRTDFGLSLKGNNARIKLLNTIRSFGDLLKLVHECSEAVLGSYDIRWCAL